MRTLSLALSVAAGAIAFGLIWVLAHTIFSASATAVTVALFVYTIGGLASYSYGRASDAAVARYVGIGILVAVLLRLGLVDFWSMALFWKIITFLGIGALFIGAVLLEQKGSDSRAASHTDRE